MASLIDAAETVKRLGISKATLYAYVSRGQIRAAPDPADPRRKLYRAEDVEALRTRKRRGRRFEAVAQSTLDWGVPILDSAITLIRDGRLFYRGQEATALAEGMSVEALARLLWQCGDIDPFGDDAAELPEFTDGMLAKLAGSAPIDRLTTVLPLAQSMGLTARLRNRASLWTEAAHLIRLLAAVSVGMQPSRRPVAEVLGAAWRLAPAQIDLVRMALILSADHELNPSTFTVRCVASTSAGLPACLLAGLAALSGPLHGGMVARVEAFLDDSVGKAAPHRLVNAELAEAAAIDRPEPRQIIAQRLQRGETLPGFGHPLYPEGDPRGRALLARLPVDDPARALASAVAALGGEAPNIDFGLAALVRHLDLPSGAGFTLFALGRSIGWIAHALEQSKEAGRIRPRARYIGPEPGSFGP